MTQNEPYLDFAEVERAIFVNDKKLQSSVAADIHRTMLQC